MFKLQVLEGFVEWQLRKSCWSGCICLQLRRDWDPRKPALLWNDSCSAHTESLLLTNIVILRFLWTAFYNVVLAKQCCISYENILNFNSISKMYLYPVFHYGVLGYISYLSIYCLYSYSTTNIMLNCLFIDVIFCKYCTTWSLYDFKLLLIYIIYNLIGWSLKVVSLLNPEMLNCWWHALELFLNPLCCLWAEQCFLCVDIHDWKDNCFCFF